jgi:hypothetical protein
VRREGFRRRLTRTLARRGGGAGRSLACGHFCGTGWSACSQEPQSRNSEVKKRPHFGHMRLREWTSHSAEGLKAPTLAMCSLTWPLILEKFFVSLAEMQSGFPLRPLLQPGKGQVILVSPDGKEDEDDMSAEKEEERWVFVGSSYLVPCSITPPAS